MAEYNPEELISREGVPHKYDPESGKYTYEGYTLSPADEARARISHSNITLLNIHYERLTPLHAQKHAADQYKKKHGHFPADYDEKSLDQSIQKIQEEINEINDQLYSSGDDYGCLAPIVGGVVVAGIGTIAISPFVYAYNHWDKVTAFAGKAVETVFQMGVAGATSMAVFTGLYKASELAVNKVTGKDHYKVNAGIAGAATVALNVAAYKHMREEHIHTATGLLKDVWNHGAHFVHTVVAPIAEIGAWGAFGVATYAVGHEVSDYVQDRVAGKSSGLVNKISGVAAFAAAALGMYHITHADAPAAPVRQPVEYSAPLQPTPAPAAP